MPDYKEEDEECQGLGIMTMSVEDVRAKSPIKSIPTLIGDMSYKAINEMREALYHLFLNEKCFGDYLICYNVF